MPGQGILIFCLFLGPLIFFHELGHYLFARFCGVRVETFSIGFGPKLFQFKRGFTTYALSLIPIGGYVKMFGDDATKDDSKEDGSELTEEDKAVAFNYKTKWQKFWIIFGGPLANIIFAYVIYTCLFITGQKVPQAKFGIVKTESSFYRNGVRTGDIIIKVNENDIISIDDLGMVEDEITSLTILRGKNTVKVSYTANLDKFIKEFFENKAELRYPLVIDKNLNQYIINFAKESINWNLSLEQVLENNQTEELFLYPVKKLDLSKFDSSVIDFTNPIALKGSLEKSEYYFPDMQVENIVMESAADKAGIKKDDIIIQIGSQKVNSFLKLRELIQDNGSEKAIDVTLLRNGETIKKSLTPIGKDIQGKKIFTIGVYSNAKMMPLLVDSEPKGVFESIMISFPKTWHEIEKVALGYKKLFMREVSMDNIGGPIAIGKAATDSFNISLSYFFKLMAMISINLGLINLLPIPVLDGGHILFLILEFLNRGPLSKRKLQIAQQFGVWMLFALIFIALFNDISRLL